MSKPTILTFVPYYLPGYKSGGPIRTIANLVEHLGDEFQFRIVTSDRDATDSRPYSSIEPDTWTRKGSAWVYYSSPHGRTFRKLRGLISETPHDALYLNSFFFPDFTIKPLVLRRLGLLPDRPVILAPRGEFSAGALALKSRKKRVFVALARAISLYKGLIWQASSEHEAQDIVRVMGPGRSIFVAPNLPSNTGTNGIPGREKRPDRLKILFLSRITPKKRLDYALKVLKGTDASVSFDVVGPVRDSSYWSECRALMSELPENVETRYLGSVEHNQVFDLMASYDLFFLPTAGENYGHVIQEALSVGTPVLISDQTPWRSLENSGVGWDISLESPERFMRAIETCAAMTPADYRRWRAHIAQWQLNRGADAGLVEMNRALFYAAVGADNWTGDQHTAIIPDASY